MLLPSGITQYLRWVSTIPMLSRVGEILLAYKRDQGDKEARGKLVESNHALVIDVAKKRLKACRNLPSMELSLLGLINVGVLGLMKGVDRYRQERGTKVSTYVTHWIRQAINREIANTVYHIRKPEYAQTAITQLGRESRGAGLDLFDTVTRSEEIAGATSFGVDEVEGIRDTASVIAVSLGENGEAENWTQQGWGANGDDQTDVISERIFFANIQEKALEILKEIWPEKNWERNTGIFKLRVLPTLQGEEAFLRTREEVGKEFSVTHERVRQIESEWLDACKLAAMKSDMAPASYLESLERLKDGIAAFIDAEPKKVFSIKEIMKKFDLTRVTYKYLTEQLHEEGRITAVKMPRKRALRVTSVKTRSAVRKSIRHHLSIDQAA